MSTPAHPPLRSFGRIKSRAIKPRQAALFDTLLPGIALPDPKAGPIDPLALMPEATAVWLEIGFGGGEHLAAQAARHPEALMIGCEPFLNGVASALRHIEEGGLKNVRIHTDDARDVMTALPDASLDRVMILFDTLLPGIALPDPKAGAIDPLALMPGAEAVWLEIGFGGGEHLAEQAARHPDALMIGCEPFLNGVASALRHIEEGGLKNVRLHADDARDVMTALPDASLDRVMILFPDPWHKARHNKRRLVQVETAAEIARLLKPGGALRFVTDWKDYADWALEKFERTPGLAWQAEAADDWRTAPADHVITRYEEKKLGDTAPIFLDFLRT